MDKLNLPEQLKDWKVLSPVPDAKGYPSFNIERTEFPYHDLGQHGREVQVHRHGYQLHGQPDW